MFNHPPISPVTRLNLDILNLILSYLDPYSLARLSKTCRLFCNIVRRELSFETAIWYQRESRALTTTTTVAHDSVAPSWRSLPRPRIEPPDHRPPKQDAPPPVFHLRCLAKIGRRLYMPFMAAKPVCYVYDIDANAWTHYPLQKYPGYTSFVAPVVAIGTRLYMFGGRKIASATLSNEVHVIDIETWTLDHVQLMQGPLPTPRCDHTVDVLENRYLIVFGGVCSNSQGENDLAIFDTKTNMWTEPRTTGQIPPVRYGHASAVSRRSLYIFGGCETRAEGHLVHDILYRLDCTSWTWYKYDHPEAYSYRRSQHHHHHRHPPDVAARSPPTPTPAPTQLGQQQQQPGGDRLEEMVDSLRQDLIIETTGHPPRDRFHCILQPVGPHKLLVLGGHTVRQDSEDRNVLHAHSLRSIDVFDLKRNHWSAVMTSASEMGENNIYPQDVSAFLMDDDHPNREGHRRLVVIGQQKIFSTPMDSYGEYCADFSNMSTGSSMRCGLTTTMSAAAAAATAAVATTSEGNDTRYHPYQTHPFPLLTQHLPSLPVEGLRQQQQYTSIHTTFTRSQLASRTCRLSRPIADYEGFLDSIAFSEEDDESYHGRPPIDGLLSAFPTIASGSSPDTMYDEHQYQQYTLEPLSIVLALNQA